MSEQSKPPIRLMKYNPLWVQEFEQSRSSILQATEGWVVDVQHIGSTFLKDGIAQPIVDLMAGLDDMRGLNEAAMLIEGLNFRRVETPEWCAAELSGLLLKPRFGEVTHTVLLLRRGGACWNRALAIRSRLESHLSDWQMLQNVKLENRALTCDAHSRYAVAKDLFFANLEDEITDR
jgi:GrpB-like predicted nucleotidyltransferase (UPF0157 family)